MLQFLKNIILTILVFHSIPHHLRAYWKGKFKQTKFNPKQIDRHDGDREHLLKHDEYDGVCSKSPLRIHNALCVTFRSF